MLEVALFIPCYVDQLYPQVGLATADLLERYGVKVVFPEEQTCCGQPMSNSGFTADAAMLQRKMSSVFAGYEYVVCPSGSCAVAARPLRVYELCEFLHDVLHVTPRGRFAHRVGLHQSCHGLRELRLGSGSERRVPPVNKVRALLEGLEGIELTELSRPDDCCGFGGTFAVAEPELSCQMGQDRLADHRRAGSEIITGTDISCLMHLGGLISRAGQPQRVLHIAELLAEATR